MMTPFESAVRGSLEGSHGGRVIVDDELGHRALHHHAGLNPLGMCAAVAPRVPRALICVLNLLR